MRAEIAADKALLLAKMDPALAAENFAIVQPGPDQVAIVSMDGEPKHLVLPNTTRAFWKVVTAVDVEMIDTAENMRIDKRHLNKLDVARGGPVVVSTVVESHEAGLLYVDGEFVERLKPGRHAFWGVGRTVRIAKVDLRPQPLEVTAQEILTKDRVGIRVTLTAFARIVDPEKAALASSDVNATLYRLIQFAIREAVAARTLDEILAARDTIDAQVRAYVSERAAALGAEIGEIGVKDIILPGDVRELLEQGRRGRARRQGQPHPPPGGDGRDTIAAQHLEAHGEQPAVAALEGARGAGEAGREGRPHRPAYGIGWQRLRGAVVEPLQVERRQG